jgi:hypothetical protein
MARKDLANNADFKLYQEDLKVALGQVMLKLRAAMDQPGFLNVVMDITSEIKALTKVLRLTASYGEKNEEVKMETEIRKIWTN